MATIETSSIRHENQTKGHLEEFKLAIDSFKNRIDMVEVDASDSRRCNALMARDFEVHKEEMGAART